MDLSELRKEYATHGLSRDELLDSPMAQFKVWFDQAKASGITEPNAMVLSTVKEGGSPLSRTVLLKSADDRGLAFYTNYNSTKGRNLAHDPRASLLFPWFALERQIHISGSVIKTSEQESDAYFARRPYGSQLGAWVSEQSETIPDRMQLEHLLEEFRKKYPEGRVPRPPHWGGFILIPETFEFWQGRLNRLHDRFIYTKSQGNWVISRLSP
jgi:pyridoxamine 5'-phosphate oxidase